MREEGENKFGCIGSWIILGIIAIICSVVDFIKDAYNDFVKSLEKDFGIFAPTVVPISIITIIIIVTYIYNKSNRH